MSIRTRRRLRALSVVLIAAVSMAALPAASAEVSQWRPPEAQGAPFFPVSGRSRAVIERAETLRQLDALRFALRGLGPDGPAFTELAIRNEIRRVEANRDDFETALARLDEDLAPWGIEAGIFPVDELRKPFYDDWGEPRSGGRRHAGNDTLAHIGVPIRAIEDSVVERTTNSRLGGRSIYLVGASGARWYYAHLDEIASLEAGDQVYGGEQIGTVGDTGNARGAPHLHLQWAPDGESGWQNPFPLLAELWGRDPNARTTPQPDVLLG